MDRGSTPVISVVMAIHGRGLWLESAIESVRSQSFQNWELICVLDQASPEAGQLIERESVDPRISVLHLENPAGAAAARNHGLRASRAGLIAVLDSDDEWADDHLEAAVNYLNRNKDVVLVGAQFQVIDGEGHNLGSTQHLPTSHIAPKLLIRNRLCHSSVVYRKDLAESVGAYPEDVRIGEDYCLWLKLAAIGNVKNLDRVSVRYRRHASQTSRKAIDSVSSQEIRTQRMSLAKKLHVPLGIVKVFHSFWLKRQGAASR
jgi:glycosyltransferase involved in cell wall biosynthesis